MATAALVYGEEGLSCIFAAASLAACFASAGGFLCFFLCSFDGLVGGPKTHGHCDTRSVPFRQPRTGTLRRLLQTYASRSLSATFDDRNHWADHSHSVLLACYSTFVFRLLTEVLISAGRF